MDCFFAIIKIILQVILMLDNCKLGAEVITSFQQYNLQDICYYHTISIKGFIVKDYITRVILVKFKNFEGSIIIFSVNFC